MKLQNFFSLVHSLTDLERLEFSKFMHGKKKSLTYQLYSRVLKASDLSEASLSRIKGKEFKDSSIFWIYREKVMEAILDFLVRTKQPTFPVIQLIEEAFCRDAEEFGLEILKKEIANLEALEDYNALEVFHALVERLREDYGIKITLPPEFLTIEQVRGRTIRSRILKAAIESTRKATKVSPHELQKLIEGISNIASREYECRTNQILGTKLKRNIEFLKGNYREAFSCGERLVNMLKEAEFVGSDTSLVREMLMLFFNAAYLNMHDLTTRYSIELSSLLSNGLKVSDAVMRAMTYQKVLLAYKNVNVELASECALEMHEVQKFFEKTEAVAKLYHTLGLTFFAATEYQRAIDCFQIVRTLAHKGSGVLQWEPQLLMSISLFELGRTTGVEELIRSAGAVAKKLPEKYPRVAIQSFKKVLSSPQFDHKEIFQWALANLKDLLLDSVEKRSSLTIQVEFWFESKVHGVSLKDIVLRQSSSANEFIRLDYIA